MELAAVNQRLAEVHQGRRWIVAVEASAGAASYVKQLDEWGAEASIVVAAAPGVGDQPETDVIFTDAESGDTMMTAMRGFLRSIVDPSPALLEAIAQFDPDGDALVVIPDVHSATSVFGRRVYGFRSRAAQALEDKMQADELWDAAGVVRAPSQIVSVDQAPRAALRLANEHGTVWVADNRLGWHGGGNYAQWIGPDDSPDEAVAWFSECAHRVRVMPFLEGIACSIHGFVTRTGAAAFRPVEMVTLRRTDRRAFVYGGVATYWDPCDSDREQMRDVARRVAHELSRRVGYLGPFSVDGVMTAAGFRPTELNPRMSAGFGRLASSVEDLELASLVQALREGDLDVDPEWLEDLIVAAADARRAGGTYSVVQGHSFPTEMTENGIPVVFEDGRLRRTAGDEAAAGTVEGGQKPAGAFVRLALDPEQVPAGPSIGPMGVALMAFVESEWGLRVGPVAAAPDVRKAALLG